MMFRKSILYFIITTSFILLSNCSQKIAKIINGQVMDGEYDNHPPLTNMSEQVDEIQNSIALINCTAYYAQYEFDFSDKVWKEDLSQTQVLEKGDAKNISQSSAATGMVLAINNGKILLLTCNHVIDYPPEVFEYYTKFFGENYVNIYLKKKKQTQFVNFRDDVLDVKVVARDPKNDIAILSGKSNKEIMKFQEPDFTIGSSKDLKSGNFIYVFGFPKGHKMISNGIVSIDEKRKSIFLIDTPFNRGLSGGIVFAIRDGSPNFEMVGMATSSAANFEYILKPDENIVSKKGYNKSLPYQGQVYIEEKPRIRYGITYVNNIDLIIDFLQEHETKIKRAGFSIEHIFARQAKNK